nr:Unknown Function [uncultured bacterium]AIA13343.1 Unknown Function [uncultured bacterium]
MDPSTYQPGSPYFRKLRELLAAAKGMAQLHNAIVNAPFHELRHTTHLDLGIIVLLLVNQKDGTIDRTALSDTDAAHGAVRMSEKPFAQIRIPASHSSNIIARAIADGKPHSTSDWKYLFVPALTSQAARFNQAGAGIECSQVYPLQAGDGGALIFSFFQPHSNLGAEHVTFMKTYSEMVSEALRTLRPSA